MSVPAGYKATEVGVIPADWKVIRLGELLSKKPSYGINAPAVPYDDRLPRYLRITDIAEDGKFRNSSAVSVSHPAAEHYYLDTGDVVFARTGASTGKSYRYREADGQLVYAGFLIRVSPSRDRLDPTYLAAQVRTQTFQRYVAEVSQRSGQPGINGRQLAGFQVPIPPTVTEQAAIAEALSDIDEAIAAVEAVIAKKRALKTATMQALLSGTRRLPGFGSSTPSDQFKQTEIGKIPKDWEVAKLGDVGKPVIGLTYSPLDVRETGTLVLRSSNVQDGALAFENNVYVDPRVASKALVKQNDILICVRNGSRDLIGKCAKIDSQADGMAFGAFMSIFRSPENDFVFHQFQSDLMRRQINEHLGATINQITNSSLVGFKIAWPIDPKERASISSSLSDFDKDIGHQESKIAKLRRLRAGMMQQLLTGKIRLI